MCVYRGEEIMGLLSLKDLLCGLGFLMDLVFHFVYGLSEF